MIKDISGYESEGWFFVEAQDVRHPVEARFEEAKACLDALINLPSCRFTLISQSSDPFQIVGTKLADDTYYDRFFSLWNRCKNLVGLGTRANQEWESIELRISDLVHSVFIEKTLFTSQEFEDLRGPERASIHQLAQHLKDHVNFVETVGFKNLTTVYSKELPAEQEKIQEFCQKIYAHICAWVDAHTQFIETDFSEQTIHIEEEDSVVGIKMAKNHMKLFEAFFVNGINLKSFIDGLTQDQKKVVLKAFQICYGSQEIFHVLTAAVKEEKDLIEACKEIKIGDMLFVKAIENVNFRNRMNHNHSLLLNLVNAYMG